MHADHRPVQQQLRARCQAPWGASGDALARVGRSIPRPSCITGPLCSGPCKPSVRHESPLAGAWNSVPSDDGRRTGWLLRSLSASRANQVCGRQWKRQPEAQRPSATGWVRWAGRARRTALCASLPDSEDKKHTCEGGRVANHRVLGSGGHTQRCPRCLRATGCGMVMPWWAGRCRTFSSLAWAAPARRARVQRGPFPCRGRAPRLGAPSPGRSCGMPRR